MPPLPATNNFAPWKTIDLEYPWYKSVDDMEQSYARSQAIGDREKDCEFDTPIMLDNGSVWSRHKPCRRYVQSNHICEFCHDFDKFPLRYFIYVANCYFLQWPNDPQRERHERQYDEAVERLVRYGA